MITKRMPIALLVVAAIATVLVPGQISAQASTNVSPVAPRRAQVEAVINEAYEKFKNDTNGKNADYIPYLAKVDSKLFGIAVVTTDNQVVTKGDVTYSFSIQSISKVYSLALAMEEQGPDKVLQKIGSEPTGRLFQFPPIAVVDMPTHSGNPFVNAGAIATVSLISGNTADEKWNKILNFYSRAAGEKLVLIDEVLPSLKRQRIPETRRCRTCWRSMTEFMRIRLSQWMCGTKQCSLKASMRRSWPEWAQPWRTTELIRPPASE